MMNISHRALLKWGYSHILPSLDVSVIGYWLWRGGANLLLFLKRCPKGKVCGVDYISIR
ncbi:hypothetical protein [Clostridium sp. BJN0013]|uniref:hypothetical protein n=1 Tax=Clostridium sp. BJN0013 TaxID=3236840 RepID=UPI0034C6AA4B